MAEVVRDRQACDPRDAARGGGAVLARLWRAVRAAALGDDGAAGATEAQGGGGDRGADDRESGGVAELR
jgi:hypothetical protein